MKKSVWNNVIWHGGAVIIILGFFAALTLKLWQPATMCMVASLWVWSGLCLLLNIHPMIEKQNYSRQYCRSTALWNFVFAAFLVGVVLIPSAPAKVLLAVAGISIAVGKLLAERREKRNRKEDNDVI